MPKKRKKTGLYLKAGLIKSFLNQCRLKLVTLVDTFDLVNPKAQKFSKPDLAKFINCAEGKPYNVVWGAEVNLTKFQVDMEKRA